MIRNIVRGDVVYLDLGQHPNSNIQSGLRPCILVSNNLSNKYSKTINVLPFSAQLKKNPVHVRVQPKDVNGFFEKESDSLAEQIITKDKKDIISKVGHLDESSVIMKEINKSIGVQLGLISNGEEKLDATES